MKLKFRTFFSILFIIANRKILEKFVVFLLFILSFSFNFCFQKYQAITETEKCFYFGRLNCENSELKTTILYFLDTLWWKNTLTLNQKLTFGLLQPLEKILTTILKINKTNNKKNFEKQEINNVMLWWNRDNKVQKSRKLKQGKNKQKTLEQQQIKQF